MRLALVDELELEVAGAQCDGGGLALGDEADAQAAEAGEGDAKAVVHGEALELQAVLTVRRGLSGEKNLKLSVVESLVRTSKSSFLMRRARSSAEMVMGR